MVDEVDPSVPEKRATHKANAQKWIIGVIAGIFLVLCGALVLQIFRVKEKQNERPAIDPPVAEVPAAEPDPAERFV